MKQLVQPLAKFYTFLFILIGALGFVFSDSVVAFEAETLRNALYLITGMAGWLLFSSFKEARMYLIVFGAMYMLLTFDGFILNGDIFGLTNARMYDNWFYLGAACLALAVGIGSWPKTRGKAH